MAGSLHLRLRERRPMNRATSTATAPLTCRVLTTLEEWQQLEPQWDGLLKASPDSTPWQSFAFLTGWWRHLSERMPLRLFVVERAGSVCLVMPLQISTWRMLPGLPVRMLEPVSMVMDVNRPRMALGVPDRAAYHCAFDAIWQHAKEWDLIRLDEKAWDDAEVALLRDYALAHESIFRQHFSHLIPYLDLRQSWQGFLQQRSQRMRKNLKAARRKLEQLGTVRLQGYESAAEIREAFRIILDLHSRSRKKKLKIEHSTSPAYQEFFRAWADNMAATGQCRAFALFCGEQPVAATIAFTSGDVYYSTQIVHDEQYAACSPGTLLESMEIEYLMGERRHTTYDFLGSFLNNKLRWTDDAAHTTYIFVLQRSFRNFILDGYYTWLKPFVRPIIVALYRKITGKQAARNSR
jgi:CelD/BcsL family acetyltransferase involved in cellulose biosynthesis